MKALKIIGIVIGSIVLLIAIASVIMILSTPNVPDEIMDQFNTDSSQDLSEIELVDSLFEDIMEDPEFDFSEEVDDTVISV
jgi:uncharacterized membrane protein YhiD involved in acid resistance